MKLPNSAGAFVPRAKLTRYLLSQTHPVGHSKAVFFRSFGYNDQNVELLEQALLAIAREGVVVETESSPYGMIHVVEGNFAAPIGSTVAVRTVWIIEKGENRPRFVTAYPV